MSPPPAWQIPSALLKHVSRSGEVWAANVDNRRSTAELPQSEQAVEFSDCSRRLSTSSSNLVPQSKHWYSKMGICIAILAERGRGFNPISIWPSRAETVRAHPQPLMLPKLSASFVQPTTPFRVLTFTHQTPQRSASATGWRYSPQQRLSGNGQWSWMLPTTSSSGLCPHPTRARCPRPGNPAGKRSSRRLEPSSRQEFAARLRESAGYVPRRSVLRPDPLRSADLVGTGTLAGPSAFSGSTRGRPWFPNEDRSESSHHVPKTVDTPGILKGETSETGITLGEREKKYETKPISHNQLVINGLWRIYSV